MKRLSQDEGKGASARIATQEGFTLIELLVAMLVSLIVIGGGVYGIARAFQQTSQVSDRLITSSSAEVGIQKLVLDLRFAISGPCANGKSSPTISGVQVTVPVPATGLLTLGMCEQSGTLSSVVTQTNTYASLAPAPQAVVWTCNTTGGTIASVPAETCNRTLGGNETTGFHGVAVLALSGQVNGANTPLTSGSACTTTGGIATCSYTLSSGLSNSLGAVGISASLADLKNPLNQADTTTVQTAALIPVQTSVELRNFGT